MKNVKRMSLFAHKGKRAVYAIAAAVLAGSMFLGTGMTAEAVKLADVFDAQAYADKYPDLKEAYGDDLLALYRHYQAFGKDEGRNAETNDIVEDTDEDDEEVLDGTYKEYWENGSVKSITVYTNGRMVKQTTYTSTGQLSSVSKYDSNGKLSRRESWVYGIATPNWTVSEYVNGIIAKKTTTYYILEMNGELYGVDVFEYDSNGKLTKKTFYDKNGKISSTTTY